jgi:xylulokinase
VGVVQGVDVSTTATKAVIVDAAGSVVATAGSEYDYESPRPLWSEQDPRLWWDGGVAAITGALAAARVSGADVEAVGLTGQMHGLTLLDRDGEVLRPAILWNDQRTAAECDEIRALVGRERLIAISGNDALTGFTAPKLVWVRHHEPEVWSRIARVLLPKDYFRLRLTGVAATDVADGSGTILFDLAARTWSAELVETLGIDPGWLPRTFEGPVVTGTVTAGAAAATGLRVGTPVVAGGGDQAANAIGVGAVESGIGALSLGTSGVVFAPTDTPVVEPDGRLHAFCHAVPGRWHLMGVMLSAAGSLRWLRDTIAPGASYDELVGAAAAIPAGSEGLLFLPYLSGERTPHPDPLARGAFVGLTVRHGAAHLTRAVLEGVAFGLRDSLELIRHSGAPPIRELRASGGGTRSELWRSILASALETDITTVATSEGAAFGAAVLAGVGAGWFPTVDDACAAQVRTSLVTQPGPDVAAYRHAYEGYRALYPALRPSFVSLAAVEAGGP